MNLLAPFELRADAPLPPDWITWLGAALRAEAPALPALPAMNADLLRALDVHGILPLLYTQLRAAESWSRLPADVQHALAEAFQASALRTLLHDAALRELAACLAAAGIPVLLLKGAATGRTAYGSPAERPVSDFDLLVRFEQAEAARATLAARGFREPGLPQRGRVGDTLRRYRAEIPLLGTGERYGGLLVELHWTLLEMPYYIERMDMAHVWRGAQPSDVPGAGRPAHAVMLLHAAAHLALHHSRDLRLIWLVDVDRLARDARLGWDALLCLTEQWNLGLALQAALAVSAAWLGTPLPAGVKDRLRELAADPTGRAMWGLGDERPGRALRRAAVTLRALHPRAKVQYAGWLALRAALGAYVAVRGRSKDADAR